MGIRRYGQSLNVFFSKLTFCHLSPFSTDPFNQVIYIVRTRGKAIIGLGISLIIIIMSELYR